MSTPTQVLSAFETLLNRDKPAGVLGLFSVTLVPNDDIETVEIKCVIGHDNARAEWAYWFDASLFDDYSLLEHLRDVIHESATAEVEAHKVRTQWNVCDEGSGPGETKGEG